MIKTCLIALALGIAAPAFSQPPHAKPAPADPAPEGVRIDQDGVLANYFAAPGQGRRPAVIVLGGSEGGLGPGAMRDAKALQAHGFNVLQLAYFGAPGEPDRLADVPLETFTRGLAWLKTRSEVDGERIGLEGGSKGAEAALLFASRSPEIKAVAVGMPSSVVWPGITYSAEVKSSWTADGRPLPFLPYAFDANAKSIYDGYAGGLKALDQHADAIIPVERINAPVMLVCGKADTLWPSCPMSEQIVARLKAKGFKRPVELLEYDDAGHAVHGPRLDPADPRFQNLAGLGGSAAGNNKARQDDWPRTLAFFDAALRP